MLTDLPGSWTWARSGNANTRSVRCPQTDRLRRNFRGIAMGLKIVRILHFCTEMVKRHL